MAQRSLVVDDVPDSRLTLRLELQDRGFVVDEAGDGAAAIAMLATGSFDAVITDIWMPGQDGIKVVQALQRGQADVPVYVITGGGPGLSLETVTTLAQVWGAEAVYLKPFDVTALVDALQTRLNS